MKNTEPTWEDARSGIDNRLDNALAFPPGLYVFGLVTADTEILGAAIVTWLGACLIWTPWIIMRVAMDGPPRDAARATAVLGIGLLPFAAYPFIIDWVAGPVGLRLYFPMVFLPAAAAMAYAALQWPRLTTARAHRALLITGALAWGSIALALFTPLAMGIAEVLGGFFTALAFLAGALAAVAAASTFYAVVRPPRARRPRRGA